MGHEVPSRGRSVCSRGRSTARADLLMSARDGALLSARHEDFRQAGPGRRCRSGSMAVEPQPAERRLGTGRHPEPSVLGARRAVLAAKRAGRQARQAHLAARLAYLEVGRLVPAVRQAIPAARAATPGRAPSRTGTPRDATSGRTGQPGHPGPLRLPRAGRRPRAGAVSPATVWGSWITKNRPRLRSGHGCERALNQRVVVPRAAPERVGRQGERLVVEMLTVPGLGVKGLAVQAPVPSRPAKRRHAARLLPVLGRRSPPLQDRFHRHKSWRGKQATRTVAASTGR